MGAGSSVELPFPDEAAPLAPRARRKMNRRVEGGEALKAMSDTAGMRSITFSGGAPYSTGDKVEWPEVTEYGGIGQKPYEFSAKVTPNGEAID